MYYKSISSVGLIYIIISIINADFLEGKDSYILDFIMENKSRLPF